MTTAHLDLPAAVVGHDETVDAERHRVLGVRQVQDVLDGQRPLPAAAIPGHLSRQNASAWDSRPDTRSQSVPCPKSSLATVGFAKRGSYRRLGPTGTEFGSTRSSLRPISPIAPGRPGERRPQPGADIPPLARGIFPGLAWDNRLHSTKTLPHMVQRTSDAADSPTGGHTYRLSAFRHADGIGENT